MDVFTETLTDSCCNVNVGKYSQMNGKLLENLRYFDEFDSMVINLFLSVRFRVFEFSTFRWRALIQNQL